MGDPFIRSAPALVPLAAFLTIGEIISIRGGGGIFIVVICVLALQLRGQGRSDFRGFGRAVIKKDSLWAFATLGAVVSYTLVDKAAMVALSNVAAISPGMRGPCFFMLQVILCYVIFWIYMVVTRDLPLKAVWVRQWPQIIMAALGTMASYSLILHVMQTNPVSYIVSLRQSGVLIAVLVGWLQLKESYGRYRFITSIVMIVGLYLVGSAH
ncbi:MAG: EamA family transporter [Desulfosarcina sp.]|nr:EamA family transporter [Desulfobacterales bacterium]